MNLEEFIKEKIRPNHKITRQAIVDEAGVSKKNDRKIYKRNKEFEICWERKKWTLGSR